MALKRLSFSGIFVCLLALTSCDPGLHGKSFIRNESSDSLKLHFATHTKDTTIVIAPNSLVDVLHFGHLGSGKEFTCCPCELQTISLQPVDSSKTLTKSILEVENWELANPNTRRFSGKEIRCEFRITEADIQ